MVSLSAPIAQAADAGPSSTRARLVEAAAAEFAARGFDGAKVDRIAARARVNKAMLYYHFRSKSGLYRAIIRGLFARVADAVAGIRDQDGTPDDQIRRYVDVLAREIFEQTHLPAIWLREVADGGRHLDADVAATLGRILAVLEAILADGRRAGRFGAVPPIVVHLGVVAPLLLFTATAPVRERLASTVPHVGPVARGQAVRLVQAATLATLHAAARELPPPAGAAAGRRRKRS